VTGSDTGGLPARPITILDYVRAVTGGKPACTGQDHYQARVGILGGCEICHATIASYNAYPARSGFWRCAGCIGDDGYATVADFTATPPADA
jgi:hypothetical protein